MIFHLTTRILLMAFQVNSDYARHDLTDVIQEMVSGWKYARRKWARGIFLKRMESEILETVITSNIIFTY